MKCFSEAVIPSPYGSFLMRTYAHNVDEKMPHIVIVNPKLNNNDVVNLRIHSECLTGDLFGSYRCDCGEQLNASLSYIEKNNGIVIYLRQEGRGIGIINKLKAYQLQDQGLNTAEANEHLGFEIDARAYDDAIIILNDMGIDRVNLLTNNPEKLLAFENTNIKLVERIPLIIPTKEENESYFDTKKKVMGHLF